MQIVVTSESKAVLLPVLAVIDLGAQNLFDQVLLESESRDQGGLAKTE
jgi:hypothetical protein